MSIAKRDLGNQVYREVKHIQLNAGESWNDAGDRFLPGYVEIEPLGHGGWGTVHKWTNTTDKTNVAVKHFTVWRNFLREYLINKEIPNNPDMYVKASDFFIIESSDPIKSEEYIMIMPMYDGTLADLIYVTKTMDSIGKRIHIMYYIIRFLLEIIIDMDSRGLYHGDIKPHNYLYKATPAGNKFPNFRILAADFGFTCKLPSTHPQISLMNCMAKSTEGFYSPERGRATESELKNRNFVYAAEYWSLIVVLIQAIIDIFPNRAVIEYEYDYKFVEYMLMFLNETKKNTNYIDRTPPSMLLKTIEDYRETSKYFQ